MGEMAEYYYETCDFIDDEPAVECKYCHKECVWEQTPAGWRLFDTNGELHDCFDAFTVVREIEELNDKTGQRKARKTTPTVSNVGNDAVPVRKRKRK